MYYYGGLDMGYMLIALIATLLGALTQGYIQKVYAKWSTVDASRRAVAYLAESGQEIDKQGANEVLTAAALTYVAAALTSVIQLLYLMSRTRRR